MNVEVRPGLRIPTWVPKSVAAAACEEYDAAVDERARAMPLDLPKFPLPLLSDERMRGVWLELQRRRSGGGFLHPADRSISAASAEERQAVAMEMLFRAAVKYTIRPGLTMTRQTEEENSLRWIWRAGDLIMDGAMMLTCAHYTHGGGQSAIDQAKERTRPLFEAAAVYRQLAKEAYERSQSGDIHRDRGFAQDRWFVRAMAGKLKQLFGSPMYGITARISSVAIGREIETRTVRQWCHPADKAPFSGA